MPHLSLLLALLLPLGPPVATEPIDAAPGLGDPLFPGLGNEGYDVQSYDLRLDVDPASNDLTATCSIRARALAPLRSFHLDLRGLQVDEVTVEGRSARFERLGEEMRIEPPEPIPADALFEVRIDYHGRPAPVPTTAIPTPAGVGWFHVGDEIFVLSEPAGAHGFFPCNDHPSDKATFTTVVTVPEDYRVASNGLPEAPEPAGEGRVTYRFSTDEPMATYLYTLGIGFLELVEDRTKSGVPLVFYLPEGTADLYREGCRATAEHLERLARWFGPYPFSSCGALVAEFGFPGALETQTLPIYGAGSFGSQVVLHELAHQWFGDALTAATWRDIWLAEGFATYSMWLLDEEREGEAAYLARVRRAHRQAVRGRVGPPASPPARGLFGAEIYVRGPLVLHALRAGVGRERMLEVARAFFERFDGGNASTEDFASVVAEKAGEDAARALRPWLFDEQVPPLPTP